MAYVPTGLKPGPQPSPARMERLFLRIDAFMAANPMTASRFGRAAAGDPRLLFDLRRGRTLRPATEARLRAFMEAA